MTEHGFEDLSSKLQQEIFRRLDSHTLYKCRLVSKNFKAKADERLSKIDRKRGWNPYFTVRPYFDINAENILGLVRLQNAAALKKFVERNIPAETSIASTSPPSKDEKPKVVALTSKSPNTSSPKSSAPPKQPLRPPPSPAKPAQRPRSGSSSKPAPNPQTHTSFKSPRVTGTASNNSKKPPATTKQTGQSKKLSSLSSFTESTDTTPSPLLETPNTSVTVGNLFPLGSVYIRRRLNDYEKDDTKNNSPPADKTEEIIRWTTVLVRNFGTQLTSFTYDDGKRKGSNLSFQHLKSILPHLPNLVYLGITSGNYEHYHLEENWDERRGVERLPPLAHLKYAALGYNTTYHLHMDILNSYGSQLKRITSSKFGYFLGNCISTNNTLWKLLDYVGHVRNMYPQMLSSLEELKAPILSSQNLMQEIIEAAAASPIIWSNLKRLSVIYMVRTGDNTYSALVDLSLFLNVVSPTLEELCLDFEQSSDLIEWLSSDPRPFEKEVFQHCRRVKKVCVSAIALFRPDDMCIWIASKFPNVKTLTFFNWWMYHAFLSQGSACSNGPESRADIPAHIAQFWTKCSALQKVSVRMETWKDECIYNKNRWDIEE